MVGSTTIVVGIPDSLLLLPPHALAADNRRQLEVCIVAILRVLYWAQGLVQAMQQLQPLSFVVTKEEQQRQQQELYVQARLGCKAILTGKLGNGASGRVYVLSTLQVSDCLRDLVDTAKENNRRSGSSRTSSDWALVPDLCLALREALAAVVEFDGLDALTDPSPRVALTLAQYTPDKARMVERLLAEQVVPRGQQLVRAVERENAAAVQRSRQYIQDYYANELPPSPPAVAPPLSSPSPSYSSVEVVAGE